MRTFRYRGDCQGGCGSPVFSRSKRAKYCSVECANQRFAVRFVRRPCKACGEIVNRAQKAFCNPKCFQNYCFKQRSALVKTGKYFSPSTKFLRRYLVETIGERCSCCGWDAKHPGTGRVPVEVEHMDGNWQNNAPSNLTLLCPNCHSLTDTYRALNRGRGRPYRLGGRENPLRR